MSKNKNNKNKSVADTDMNDESSDHNNDDDDDDVGEQIRVVLTLAADCADRSLEIPSEPIAVPASIGRQGLNALINHLLGRTGNDNSDDTDSQQTYIKFDFLVARTKRLLRTGVEAEARRSGLSLEDAVALVYFPAAQAPKLTGSSNNLPDWVGSLAVLNGPPSSNHFVAAGTYNGSVYLLESPAQEQKQTKISQMELPTIGEPYQLHKSAVKCMDAIRVNQNVSSNSSSCDFWLATGSMDQTLVLSRVQQNDDNTSCSILQSITCSDGHYASINSLKFSKEHLASGDWNGSLALWKLSDADSLYSEYQSSKENNSKNGKQATKKSKVDANNKALATDTSASHSSITPLTSFKAHASNISGISWGNYELVNNLPCNQLVTGSWDHSLKVWDIERQDCLLTLNGARVVACLDSSYHSQGIVATGHPDASVRLWDVRVANNNATGSNNNNTDAALKVSDNTLQVRHSAWVSAVQWSPTHAYHLSSLSHDGTIKVWDIRTSLPLFSIRAFPAANTKNDNKGQQPLSSHKGLCMTTAGISDTLIVGGTDCIVKQFLNCSAGYNR